MFSNSFIILCRNFFSSEYYAGFPWPSSSPWISSSDLCGKPDYLWTTVAVLRHVGTISWRPWEGMGHAEFIQHAFCFQAVNSFDGHSQVHQHLQHDAMLFWYKIRGGLMYYFTTWLLYFTSFTSGYRTRSSMLGDTGWGSKFPLMCFLRSPICNKKCTFHWTAVGCHPTHPLGY